ncbi:MAG: BamA/TamA family outer membrane protein [Planctomycetes bacterium]|nr:BamA/TamA family outer membrane protein [Phycisphaerae bacterium]NBB95352.1 BamA/TamA family outer membrane protein [Planctomycetota bacterium]
MKTPSQALAISLCVLSMVAAAAVAQQGPQTVAEVRVEGNDTLSDNAVLSYVKTREGVAYDEQMVKDDRDRLMASGKFTTAVATRELTPRGVVVTFRVVELPSISQLSIVGNKEISEDDLRKQLPLGAGDPLNAARIEAGKQAIVKQYQSKGYYFAKVTVDEDLLARKRELVYRVVEGPKVIVTNVHFEGNHYYKRLQLWMRVDTRGRMWPFIDGVLDFEQIERDVSTIRNLYTGEGFLDCEVARDISFSDDKKKAVVTYKIHEGARYRINKVVFEGNTVFSDNELARRLKLRQGTFFTNDALRTDLKTLENTYGELGYINARIEPEKVYLSPEAPTPTWARNLDGGKPGLINMVFHITERDQYRVGRIVISGNSVTQERVIRRECRFYPEQILNTVAVDYSKRRLQELRIFDKVNITYAEPADAQQQIRDVVVDVDEGRTAEFLVGVGVSSNSGLLGTVSFRERNFDILAWPTSFSDMIRSKSFRGAGQTFSVVAEPGSELFRFTIGWSTPYIFDRPYRLSGDGYFFRRGRESYDEQRLGTKWSLGHRFKNRWYGELATRLESVDLSVDSDAPVEIQADDGTHTLVGLRGSLVRDRTDSRWMPSEGDRFSVSYEQVVGTDTFGRFNTEYKRYWTLYVDTLDRKHILATRFQYGHLVGDAPTFEKFFGGGIGSVRGFEYRGISPRGTYANGAKHADPIGGDVMFFAGGEYSFPIVTEHLRGVVFLDSGTAEKDFEITTYRVSAGFGIRWQIPMMGPVPMAFDFGFPLNKSEDDETQIFSFSLGWTF